MLVTLGWLRGVFRNSDDWPDKLLQNCHKLLPSSQFSGNKPIPVFYPLTFTISDSMTPHHQSNPMEKLVQRALELTAKNIMDHIWSITVRRAHPVYYLEDRVAVMEKVVQELSVLKAQIQRRVLIERTRGSRVMERVEIWLYRLERESKEAHELILRAERELDKLCLGRLCGMFCCTTLKLAKEVDKCLHQLLDLQAMGEEFRYCTALTEEFRESEERNPPPYDDGLKTPLYHQVLSYLEQEGVQMIGVWGQGGLGKTTLLIQIRNHFAACQENGCLVIWIDVPEYWDPEALLQDIGVQIGLRNDQLENKSVAEKAAYISSKLMRKKFVLLLDDIRRPIDLSRIGVPDLTESNSKVIFTTRLEKVCTEMKPQPHRSVHAKTLTEEQAWQLFLMHVRNKSIHSHPKVWHLAKTLANYCGGLPLALCIVGRSMSGKTDPAEWKDAIWEFENSTLLKSSYHQDIMSELFSIFKYSYDNLPHDSAKSCFLYCALFPEGFAIPKTELVQLWVSEKDLGIDWDHDETNNDPHYNARNVLRTLARATLLEDHGEWVTMPKMIRSMALSIAQQDALLMAGMKLEEAPDVGSWEGMKRVSLMHNYIEELIEVPTCPNLLTLFLNKNKELLEICYGFFGFMPKLTVLNLSSTGIEELPGSISSLVSLQHLDISYTKIRELPIVLMELKRLNYFDINGLHLRFNRSNEVIRNLSSLQVLKMVCDYCYEEEGGGGEGEIEAEGEITMGKLLDDEILLKELQHLEQLTVLQITVRSFSSLQKLIATHRLSRRTQTLCLRHFEAPSVDVSLLENMENIESLFVTRCDFKELYVNSGMYTPTPYTYRCFSSITRVAVISCDYLQHLTCLVLLPNLRILEVSSCMKLGEIISGDRLRGVLGQDRNLESFSNLAVLELCLLPRLENICSTSLPLRFLYQLRVSDCPRLKKLPLGFSSILGCSIQLIADEGWFDAIEWEGDDDTRAAVLSRFNFSPVGTAYTRSFAPKQTEMAWPRQR